MNSNVPSSREIEIIRMLSEGKSSKQIADVLHISVHTVDTHRRNILKKIKVSNSSEAVMKSVECGWMNMN